MKKKVLAGAVAAVLIAAVILPRVFHHKEAEVADALPVVTTANPMTGTVEVETGLTGTVEAADSVSVIPKAAGEITAVYVKAGDMVKSGQPLVHIDTMQVDGARISMDTAQVALQDASTNLQRMQVLAAAGDISQQALEQAVSAQRSAQLQYEGAKLAYDNQIKFSDVTAPIAGKVESVGVSVHDNVSQANVLCQITGDGGRVVTFYVTDRVVGNLAVGDSITVEKAGSSYDGSISEVSSSVDQASGLFKVKAALSGAEALATGSQVKLYVTSERAADVMTIPTDAIYYNGGQAQVYTLDADGTTVHVKNVTVGVYNTEKAEITEGLSPEDQVLTSWTTELFDGAKVQTQAETSAEQAGTDAAQAETSADQTGTDATQAETSADQTGTAAAQTETGAGQATETDAAQTETSADQAAGTAGEEAK